MWMHFELLMVVRRAKLYIPSIIKTQMNLAFLFSWGRLGCHGSTENFYNFAKVFYVLMRTTLYLQGQKKLDLLYFVVSVLHTKMQCMLQYPNKILNTSIENILKYHYQYGFSNNTGPVSVFYRNT